MNWYVVYRGRRPGVYNSWRTCQDQVAGFSNNRYEWFETLHEGQHNYSNFQSYQNGIEDHEDGGNLMVGDMMLAQQVIAQMDNDVKPSRIKDFVIVVLVVVNVKLLLF